MYDIKRNKPLLVLFYHIKVLPCDTQAGELPGLQITTRPLANASNFYLWATKTLGFDRPHGE